MRCQMRFSDTRRCVFVLLVEGLAVDGRAGERTGDECEEYRPPFPSSDDLDESEKDTLWLAFWPFIPSAVFGLNE